MMRSRLLRGLGCSRLVCVWLAFDAVTAFDAATFAHPGVHATAAVNGSETIAQNNPVQ